MMDKFGNSLNILLILIFCIVYHTDAQCAPTLFGVGCRFECHCKNNESCDDFNGKCPSGCDKYWAGPSCQYRNIAVDAFIRHLDEISNSSLAVDGDISTCAVPKNDNTRSTKPFWRIWLTNNHTITELEFVTTDTFKDHFTEFKVTVEYVPKDFAKLDNYDSYGLYIQPIQDICYENKRKVSDKVINVVCNRALTGNQVRIQLEKPGTQLVICDFRIFEGRNIAYRRRAIQSSHNAEGQSASAAVDGITQTGNKNACSVTQKEKDPWWSVDLAHVMKIDRVLITPFGTNDIDGYHLFTSNDSLAWLGVNNDKGRGQNSKADFTVDVVARFIKISFENETRQLLLCEVQIFGDCLPDVCGFDCVDVCHCRNSNSEIKMSGNCTNGCQDKWTGEGKKCDRASSCTEPSGIYMSAVAVALTSIGAIALIVGSVCITIFVMKRRQTSDTSKNSSGKKQADQTRPGQLNRLKKRVLDVYYNTNLRPKKTDPEPDQELEGYMELDTLSRKQGISAQLESYSKLQKSAIKATKNKLHPIS
ncbi:uncharacterized protein LOC123559224 isoform X2 [Mercenaria mercenaria]|uniref:uncharacterized protein LOC123559224 isoform X2 n=1 Tax=Mercenaria mercenaria TaxID=6596 RepID=UPI00234E436E|nr:uncharacterized protein LOC123559224 isoform X2 [Mercenaria mercenaria]